MTFPARYPVPEIMLYPEQVLCYDYKDFTEEKAMAMKKLNEIFKILELKKDFLKKRYKIREIGLFGSYVRGEAKKTSDLDVLVEFEQPPSLLKFLELENYLSDILGIRVDLVEKKVLNLILVSIF